LVLTIRQAGENDISVLKDIIDLSFPRFFRFFAAHSVDSEEGKVLVSEQGGTVVGFAKLIEFYLAGGKYGCVLWLAVHPKNRHESSGSALVKTGAEELKRESAKVVFASVQRRNKASLATFRKVGFERIGFVGLWRLFGWRTFQLYSSIWFAPGEVVLMQC
jgi:N-acetylglutamate synthase-like GNAT family acetyltransferase